jgi:hypothetical protein
MLTESQKQILENVRLCDLETAERMKNPWYRLRVKFYHLRKRIKSWIQ